MRTNIEIDDARSADRGMKAAAAVARPDEAGRQ
jgi:hypothetical protein